MPFNDVTALRNYNTYKQVLKQELDKVGDDPPVKFQLFDKFKFTQKPLPLLVVGTYTNDFIDELKETGAVFKVKGRCALNGDTIEFAPDLGVMPKALLKAALLEVTVKGVDVQRLGVGDKGKDGVLNEPKARSKVVTGSGGRGDEDLEKTVKQLHAKVAKLFEALKSNLGDDDRKALRNKLHDALSAVNKAQALEDVKEVEQKLRTIVRKKQGEVDELGPKAVSEEESRKQRLEVARSAVKSKEEQLKKLVVELQEGLKLKKGDNKAHYEERTTKLKERIKLRREKLESDKQALEDQIKELTTTAKAETKALFERLDTLAKRSSDLERLLNSPDVGKLDDDAELDDARDRVTDGVQKMAEASEFLKDEHDRVASGDDAHGSARHGAQGGLDRSAGRAATKNEFRPDSPRNKDGVTRHVKNWNQVELTWTTLDTGKKKLTDKRKVAQVVLSEIFPHEDPTSSTAMFLNPILEKEAVDTAIALAQNCVWKYYTSGDPLLEIAIEVGPPARAPGWGYSIRKIPGFKKKTIGETVTLLEKFETDPNYTIEALMKDLNVRIETDRTGAGAMLVPYAKVILRRETVNGEWKSRSHFPDDRITEQNWDIDGRILRKTPTGPTTKVGHL